MSLTSSTPQRAYAGSPSAQAMRPTTSAEQSPLAPPGTLTARAGERAYPPLSCAVGDEPDETSLPMSRCGHHQLGVGFMGEDQR
jgi:hypothetical protein